VKNKEDSVKNSVPYHTPMPCWVWRNRGNWLKNLMIVVVLDLEWNPDLSNTEPKCYQCIMMFQRAHTHRKSNV